MSPIVKQLVGYAIVVLESALAILRVVPGNQGEEVIAMVIVALKAVQAGQMGAAAAAVKVKK